MSALQQAVADLVIKATQAAEAAGKFAVEQLPDIAQQYVLYKGIMSLSILFVCLLVACFIGYAVRITNKKVNSDEWSSDAWFLCTLFCAFPTMFIAIEGSKALETAVMAFFAPKILLIQWAAELVK